MRELELTEDDERALEALAEDNCRLEAGELREVPYVPTASELRREDIAEPWTHTVIACESLRWAASDLFRGFAALVLLPWRLVAPFRSGGVDRHFPGHIDFVEVDE